MNNKSIEIRKNGYDTYLLILKNISYIRKYVDDIIDNGLFLEISFNSGEIVLITYANIDELQTDYNSIKTAINLNKGA